MARLSEVNPESFVDTGKGEPATGRGAWTRSGIGFSYRYQVPLIPEDKIGLNAEKSMDHWAVAAGCLAIQKRLKELGFLKVLGPKRQGVYGLPTERAVKRFQAANNDPAGNASLEQDGTVGRSDARALFTPLVLEAEAAHRIPDRLLLGETNHESAMDPGAIGYFIFYPEYRGVDRGMSQINSKYNPQVSWLEAYDPRFSLDWSAKRMRAYFDQYLARYPKQPQSVLWDAAICAHNNPWAAGEWAKNGAPPTEQAAKYVASVKTARY